MWPGIYSMGENKRMGTQINADFQGLSRQISFSAFIYANLCLFKQKGFLEFPKQKYTQTDKLRYSRDLKKGEGIEG
jgi:hypothetical protein